MTNPLEKLEALAKAATTGKWQAGRPDMMSYDSNGSAFKYVYLPYDEDKVSYEIKCATANPIEDSQFIAAANPQTVLTLLEIVRVQSEALKRISVEDSVNIAFARPEDEAQYYITKATEALSRVDALLKQLGGE